jgi:molybdopterin/thiamine biosynthesis adenylyltransferase/rhodanese-related sulfurtransferase
MLHLSKEELSRYDRHIILPSFGPEAQQKLKSAKVLVVGSGGLGSPLLLYLAAAGVGTIGIADFDKVDDSNLHRQVLFNINDIGKPKAEVAAEKLKLLNPHINPIAYNTKLTSGNALEIINQYDIVADGTDNFPTRYLVNDACVITGKPNVYASVFQFEGQVAVFNYNDGPNYRDLYPTPPKPGVVPDCATGGVLGVLPGIIGSLQALEVIKIITGIGEPLSGKFYIFDALRFEGKTFIIENKGTVIKELIDYEAFCGIKNTNEIMKEITVKQLREWEQSGKEFQIIDVREPKEYNEVNIGAELIPLGTVLDNTDKIRKDIDVVVHCRSGVRSANAINELEKKGYKNLYNLKGGILAYLEEVKS